MAPYDASNGFSLARDSPGRWTAVSTAATGTANDGRSPAPVQASSARPSGAGPTGAGLCSVAGYGGHSPTPNSRATSMRCTSLVPSPISRIFASRHMRATGYSFMNP